MTKGRFIAGAVCPQCQMLDRLLVEKIRPEAVQAETSQQETRQQETRQQETRQQETRQQIEQRRCVNCGYTDQLQQAHLGGVPRGKPEKAGEASAQPQEAQKIRIFDPGTPRK